MDVPFRVLKHSYGFVNGNLTTEETGSGNKIIHGDNLEALKLLRAGELPMERLVVLADLRMPRMSGLDLLKELRTDPRLKRIPTVMLTTSDDPHDRDAAFCLGAAGYFVKPAAPGRFKQIMDALRSYWSVAEFAPPPLAD